MAWINANGAAFQFFAAVAVVVVTAVYVVLTNRILRENRRLVRLQSRPNVVAFVEANENHAAFFVIENVGPGFAKDVRVEVPSEWSANPQLGNLGRIGFVAKGISLMPAGRRIHSFIAIMTQIDKETLQPFTARITYTDGNGAPYSSDFEIDLSQMFGIKPSDHAVPGNLVGAR